MKNWKLYKLEELCVKITDGAHFSPKEDMHGLPMASVKDLTNHGVNISSCKRVSEKDFINLIKQGCSPEYGDVLIAKDGNSALDTVCTYKQEDKIVLLSSVAILRPNNKVIPDFLKYYFTNEGTKTFLKENFRSGSAIPRVVLKDFKNVPIFIPSIKSQSRIASILSSLDDKIELNRRMNQTLEQMAQALFNHYFVDNIDPYNLPEGWRWGNLKEITLRITKGTTPTTLKKQFVSSGINFLKVETLTESGTFDLTKLNYIDKETDELLARSRVEENDILFSIAGTLGRVAKANNSILPANTNQALAIIRPDEATVNPLYVYYVLKSQSIREDIFSQSVQGVQANLSLTVLSNTKVVIPKKEDIEQAFNFITPLQKKIEVNETERRVLSKIRDTLLPKLMSGEIDVDALMKEEEQPIENLETA